MSIINPSRKQIILIIIVFIAVVLSPGFISLVNGYTRWEKNVIKNGISFKKVRYGVKDNKVKVIIGYLAQETVIGSFPCSADWVHFYPDWKVSLFNSSKDFRFKGIDIPKGTWVMIDNDGSISCVFPNDTEVQGYLCESGGGVKGTRVTFYASGRLKYFFSKQDLLIDSIACKGNPLLDVNLIGLHENGKLKICILAEPAVIDGKTYGNGQQIFLDSNGKITDRSIMD